MGSIYIDFSKYPEEWDFRVDNFAGYEVSDNILKLYMGPTEALYYSNVEVSDGSFDDLPWRYAVFEARIRFEGSHLGSAGWGFWNHSMVVDKSYPIWFIYLRSLRSYPLNGFFIQVGRYFRPILLFRDVSLYYVGLKLFPFLAPIKIVSWKPVFEEFSFNEWHVYRVEWGSKKIHFYIDGSHVSSLPNYMPMARGRADIWLDNAVFRPPARDDYAYVYRHVTHENRGRSFLEVDWIRISEFEGGSI